MFVEALKGEHNLTVLDPFKESSEYERHYYHQWMHDFPWRNSVLEWRKRIAIEINKLTWSNHFHVDKDAFLHEVVLGPGSPDKNRLLCAMDRANLYDITHKDISDMPAKHGYR